MTSSVSALVSTPDQAEEAIDALRLAGFSASDVSFLYSDSEGSHSLFHINSTKAPEGAVVGGSAAGLAGGIAGFLLGMGALVIPGIGPFVAAGPIMTALSGAAVGATFGGLGGCLIGFGLPEYEAKLYAGKVTQGNMLIVVHCDKAVTTQSVARETLLSVKASDIFVTAPIPIADAIETAPSINGSAR